MTSKLSRRSMLTRDIRRQGCLEAAGGWASLPVIQLEGRNGQLITLDRSYRSIFTAVLYLVVRSVSSDNAAINCKFFCDFSTVTFELILSHVSILEETKIDGARIDLLIVNISGFFN